MARFSRLARWESTLNACIRCGYCYEHCPVYKATRWEVDAPRGKLIILHELLHGRLEPDDYVAEKLFECFHCRRCEKACSSGVKTLELFRDARADLLDLGFSPVGTTSLTDADRCAVCLNCVRACPHEARRFDGTRVVVDPLECAGCGSCLDTCPAEAITLGRNFGTAPQELDERLEHLYGDGGPRPRSVVFCCAWSNYPGLQTARLSGAGDDGEVAYLVTACAGRLSAGTVLRAFELGAWGVLVATCQADECDHGGAARAVARMRRLREVLERLGLDGDRLQVREVGFAGAAAAAAAAGEFSQRIRELGPWCEECRA